MRRLSNFGLEQTAHAFGREQDTWNGRLDFVSGFAVPLLKPSFTSSGWPQEIAKAEEGVGRCRVKVVTPEVNLTRETFLELVEVMMVAAHEHSCVFDGFQVATPIR